MQNVEWIRLGDEGIEGNGHFFFLELNYLDIADVVIEKITGDDAPSSTGPGGPPKGGPGKPGTGMCPGGGPGRPGPRP